jgi:hypothetical protein
MALLAHAGRPDELVMELMLAASGLMAWIASSRLRSRGFPTLPRSGAWLLVGGSLVVFAGSFIIPAKFLRPPAPARLRPASIASIAIDVPTPGEHVSGQVLDVSVALVGGRVVPASTTKLSPDTGHLHLYVDGRLLSMAFDGLREPVPISDLATGEHQLRVEFVAADHAPFDPRVEATVAFVKDP